MVHFAGEKESEGRKEGRKQAKQPGRKQKIKTTEVTPNTVASTNRVNSPIK